LSAFIFIFLSRVGASGQNQFYFALNGCNSFIPTNGGIALTSGGNVGGYRDPAVSNASPVAIQSADGSVVLQQSAIGASIVTTPEGQGGGYFNSLVLGTNALAAGTAYKTIDGQNGTTTNTSWDLRFPGVIDVTSGNPWPGDGGTQNFDEDLVKQAAEYFRVALRINPYDLQPRIGLVTTYQERMQAHTFAGNNAAVFAGKLRLSPGAANASPGVTIGSEVSYWTNAVGQYRAAADIFAEAGTLMPDAATFEALDYSGFVQDTFDVYSRALGYEADAVQTWLHLSYFSTYQDPLGHTFNPVPLLASLQPYLDHLQSQLLLASQYSFLSNYLQTDLPSVNANLALLNKQKNTTIPQGLLSFIGQRSTDTPGDVIGEYAPEYVPFLFTGAPNSQPGTSFDNLMFLANQFINSAQGAESEARNTTRTFDTDRAALTSKLDDIFKNYNDQLGEICGWINGDDGQLHADVAGSLLSNADREEQHPLQSGESYGRIYQQQLNIAQAFAELKAAHEDQHNLYLKAINAQTVADLIATQSLNLAQMYLTNGDSIAALERIRGDEAARVTRQIAEEKAEEAEREANNSLLGGIVKAVAGAALTFFFPPAGVASVASASWAAAELAGKDGAKDLANVFAQNAGGHDQAALIRKTADLEAQLQLKNAEITAQEEGIRADEAATVQYAQADQTLWKSAEAWQAFLLDYDRAGLNILMAEQRLLMQKQELNNLHSHIAFLVQEMRKAIVLNNQTANPLARPDYRLWMDFTTRNAEETFLRAQEWLYLAAKALQYRVNNSASGSSSVSKDIEDILHARTAIELANVHNQLSADNGYLYLNQGAETTALPIPLRIRNYVVQNNSVVYNNDGSVNTNLSLFETVAYGTNTIAASDADWLTFLNDHIVFDWDTYSVSLQIPFSTSLNRPNLSTNTPGFDPLKIRQNPLFSPTRYSDRISYTYSQSGPASDFGVRVNIRGRALNLDSTLNVVATLRQEGASYLRSAKWVNDAGAIRLWNLKPVEGLVICSVNNLAANNASASTLSTPQFYERSAANDHWILVIDSLEGSGGNNASLLSQLSSITDIEITFSIRGFTN
jgi:hypothetical protein